MLTMCRPGSRLFARSARSAGTRKFRDAVRSRRAAIKRAGQVALELPHLARRSQDDRSNSARQTGHELRVLRATARLVVPNPIHEKRQVELLGAAGTKVVSLAPIVSHRAPHRARKVDIARQVEPDDRLRSGQAQVEMAGVVAIHDPGIAGSGLRQSFTKTRRLAPDPARIPVERIEVHDRKAETLTNPARQRRLAGGARPEDENALRHGHPLPSSGATLLPVYRLVAIPRSFGLR